MKKFFKWLGIALGVIILGLAGLALYVVKIWNPTYEVHVPDIKVEATPARLERGKELVLTLCSECHKDPETKLLTGRRLGDLPEQFGVAYSRNITKDPVHGIGAWSDGEIIWLLRTGIHPKTHRYVPPWMVKLTGAADEDLYSIVSFLRSDDPVVAPASVQNKESEASALAKLLTFIGAFKPYDYPKATIVRPDSTNDVAYGSYMANGVFACYECHSADFATNDRLNPEKSVGFYGGGNPMPNYDKLLIPTRNLTPDKDHGIGNWTEDQFVQALMTGFRSDGTLMRYPMMRFTHVPEREIRSIYRYLRTIPALPTVNKEAQTFKVADNATNGEKSYVKYGCINCHSASGVGYADLRMGYKKFPTDDQLIEFIKHPEKAYPGTVMPTWDGRIPEADLRDIASYVRSLGVKSGK